LDDRLRVCPFSLSSGLPKNFKAPIDIVLEFRDTSSGIIAKGGYRADLFRASTIEHFSSVMRHLATIVVKDATRRIRDVRLDAIRHAGMHGANHPGVT
jgi:hypothetical protein